MNTVVLEAYGVTEIIRASCGTCGKDDIKVAVIPIDATAELKLCPGCLVDLANLVFESPDPP